MILLVLLLKKINFPEQKQIRQKTKADVNVWKHSYKTMVEAIDFPLSCIAIAMSHFFLHFKIISFLRSCTSLTFAVNLAMPIFR